MEAAWARGLLSRPSLEPGALLARAAAAESGTPADGDWRASFDILVRDLDGGATLNPLGRTIAHAQLVRLLRQRIAADRLWRRVPQILDQPLDAPVIVLGHMRSGTTRLHRMLASDPRFSFTRTHETLSPLAPHALGAIASATAIHAFLNACNPQLRSIHPTSALAPEEEFGLHAFSFHGAMFEAQWSLPAFSRHAEMRDLTGVYREFHQLVQTLRWRRGEGAEAISLLKAPQFMHDLDALLAAFPGARILWIRRRFDQVVASTASLVWHQRRIQSDLADRAQIGREWLRKTRLREERAIAALERHRPPLLEIAYDEMDRDWQAQARRIYRFLGLELTPASLGRMHKIMLRTAHRGHQYAPVDFGLSPA